MTRRKVAVVTGASRGIGSAIAAALAEAGYDLCLGWNSDETAATTSARRAEAAGAAVVLIRGDVVA
ncbi:MAG TPA: SDR family NAD(P)-dependent oxidoreductase, partial [Acidimicrobiales bacterium]|nr:SDR family NAD(P)-dependent oxidoreductase [Acidimicrobiales bacterium]